MTQAGPKFEYKGPQYGFVHSGKRVDAIKKMTEDPKRYEEAINLVRQATSQEVQHREVVLEGYASDEEMSGERDTGSDNPPPLTVVQVT